MEENQNETKELSIEKLNIVDKNGNVKLCLFNQDKIPAGIFDGVEIENHRKDDNTSGIMFYDGHGNECGGLIFGSKEVSGKMTNGASLTFDKFKQDQVVQIFNVKEEGFEKYGVQIYDRPDILYPEYNDLVKDALNPKNNEEERNAKMSELQKNNVPRAFYGKDADGTCGVKVLDSKGKVRIRLIIDSEDNVKLEMLNKKGEVTISLNPDEI